MEIYLTIITTALVLTQIIRLLQNWKQLKKYGETERKNNYIMRIYGKLEAWLDRQESYEQTWDLSELIEEKKENKDA